MKNRKFYVFAIIFLVVPLVLLSQSNAEGANRTLVYQTQVKPDQIIPNPNNSKPNICRLTLKKTANNKFTFSKAEALSGSVSHFFEIEQSNYALEIWQNDKMNFTGGFNNPNVIHHELMDVSGQWEHAEIPLSEATLMFRVPLQIKDKTMTIKIYEVR